MDALALLAISEVSPAMAEAPTSASHEESPAMAEARAWESHEGIQAREEARETVAILVWVNPGILGKEGVLALRCLQEEGERRGTVSNC
ncbi:hypothetical protein M5K25_020316 [Dendrobium thyrsiflorum]|uniref:Uncharacterized protein n=1 Tax=Dendrobium thyrsiflorum TaxID=117978 RepID=A0ABD0U9P8_DENTH